MEPEETSDTYWLICPYCQHKHNDAWEKCEDKARERECESCGRKFLCWSETQTTYHAEPATQGKEE